MGFESDFAQALISLAEFHLRPEEVRPLAISQPDKACVVIGGFLRQYASRPMIEKYRYNRPIFDMAWEFCGAEACLRDHFPQFCGLLRLDQFILDKVEKDPDSFTDGAISLLENKYRDDILLYEASKDLRAHRTRKKISGLNQATPTRTASEQIEEMPMPEPPEISESLKEFRTKYPDPASVAFLMMQFEKTPAHDRIVAAIRRAFLARGITALRADDFQFHDDLFPNVKTYMHGCSMGVAVFETITTKEFNPNVSLEVGYMLALGKPICLLKDQNLQSLHADLTGKLYRNFDSRNPDGTIPDQVNQWLTSRGLARK